MRQPTPKDPNSEATKAYYEAEARAPEPEPDEPPPALRVVNASGVRQITVVWGEEHHQPIQYNGFRIGGLQLVADVHPSETVEEAHDRLYAMLDELGRKQFEAKLAGFLERAAKGAQAARKTAGRP